MKKRFAILAILLLPAWCAWAENGYELWLRYRPVANKELLKNYQQTIRFLQVNGHSPTIEAIKKELTQGLTGLLGKAPAESHSPVLKSGTLIAGSIASLGELSSLFTIAAQEAGQEGYLIRSVIHKGNTLTVITGNTDIGVLYGIFHFLRLLQTEQPVSALSILSAPRHTLRLLNHWDNLNRTVERGYAGFSIWNWHTLPDYIDQRYIDYARANASIGINGTVLTNVNANAVILTAPYLKKVAALAHCFRPYGLKVYLTARFSAPIEIGQLPTADPLDARVQQWWQEKAKEIYTLIPDFGGFLVKANSEGQPGPQDYGRNHADGANMLAKAVAPFHGIIMWRAFVYSQSSDDRFKQAYEEFKPLDGKFDSNVLVQVKNGPIDFQPREPFSPLFGAMTQTPLMMEFQLTQEYLGQGTHLVYQAPLYKEVLDADTWSKGKGSTVSKVINGSLYHHHLSGIAGVSNIGTDIDWCGHPFGQSNWYTLGRLAWDPSLGSETIADEWLRQTFTNNAGFVNAAKKIMMDSRRLLVNYMTPLGLTHIMYDGHHYGPMPWGNSLPRADWNPVYYHKADTAGIGFDRTATGSNALAQYAPEVRAQFENVQTCPDDYLLWFHHVPWDHTMQSGRTLWNELCYRYSKAVDSVRLMRLQWQAAGAGAIDAERYRQVDQLLGIQEKEAAWWRNACLLYFQTFSRQPIPAGYEAPDHTLDYYKALRFLYVP